MKITKRIAAEKIAAYLHHEIGLAALVDWAENAIMEGEFDEADSRVLANALGKVGLADVRPVVLTWEECEAILHELGYEAHVDVVAA
jgi:RNase P/RNase MRP subunit POP5